jgi:hypothetical protein
VIDFTTKGANAISLAGSGDNERPYWLKIEMQKSRAGDMLETSNQNEVLVIFFNVYQIIDYTCYLAFRNCE